MLVKMSEDQKPTPVACIISAEGSDSPKKSRLTKKHTIVIGVTCVTVAAIILAAVLGGIYLAAQQEKDLIKYTLSFTNKNSEASTQNVASSQTDNSVQYHVVKDGQETWIVDDFGKDIQTIKIKTANGVSCFATPLNESNAQNPKTINGPQPKPASGSPNTMFYTVADNPINDITFLGAKANAMCANIPVYWLTPQCMNSAVSGPVNFSSTPGPAGQDAARVKRGWFYAKYVGYYPVAGVNAPCYSGCCWAMCSNCLTTNYIYEYVSAGSYYCNWVFKANCAWKAIYGGNPGPWCQFN